MTYVTEPSNPSLHGVRWFTLGHFHSWRFVVHREPTRCSALWSAGSQLPGEGSSLRDRNGLVAGRPSGWTCPGKPVAEKLPAGHPSGRWSFLSLFPFARRPPNLFTTRASRPVLCRDQVSQIRGRPPSMDYWDRGEGQPHGQNHRQAPDHRSRTAGGHSEREPHPGGHLLISTQVAIWFCF